MIVASIIFCFNYYFYYYIIELFYQYFLSLAKSRPWFYKAMWEVDWIISKAPFSFKFFDIKTS